MSNNSLFEAIKFARALSHSTVARTDHLQTPVTSVSDIAILNSLAVRSLVALFDEGQQLFAPRVITRDGGFQQNPSSRKQTIIAILGLHRLKESGGLHPFDLPAIEDAIFEDRRWVKSAGDLGLLMWFTAVCRPDQLRLVLGEFDVESALATYVDGREAQTRGLAWFLTGIAHARQACPKFAQSLTDVAVDAYHLLQENQSDSGVFAHARTGLFPIRSLLRHVGTFTDQISAIFALSTFAQIFEVEEPLVPALACANTMCAIQGELGQWWLLYYTRSGRALGRHTVSSPHEYGMAASALMNLEAQTHRNFSEAILKALSWLIGGKDLRNIARSNESGMWRSIRCKNKVTAGEVLMNFLASRGESPRKIRIGPEVRPDHFGWFLYAFGVFGLDENHQRAVIAH